MNRRAIWLGIGGVFALAVGSGYLPDLMLAREEAAARDEGLIAPPEPPPAPNQDARLAYEAVRKRYPDLLQLFRAGSNLPQIEGMLGAFVEASRRPVFRPPAPEQPFIPTPGVITMAPPTAYADQELVPDLMAVTQRLAKTATSEEPLRGAARIAAHLQNEDPAGIPTTNWSDLATAVLNGADRLRLPAEARARVAADLAPPDPVAFLRRRASLLLASSADSRSAGARRERVRFIRFWREFLKTAPREPQAFAQAVTAAEDRITAADGGVYAGYLVHTTSPLPTRPWAAWANGLAKVRARLR